MKFLFAVVLFISCYGFSQKTTEFPMQESSLLWKIDGPGISKPSYLFGTMHLIQDQYFIFPEKLQKFLKKSDLLIMELAGLPDQKTATSYLQLKEGSFFDYFSAEQSDSILIWAKKELGMNEQQFRNTMSKMKPFVVVQLATQMHFIGKTKSYEMEFERIATENKIKIMGLETIADQMAIFDALSQKETSDMVMESIRNTKETIEMTEQMQQLYARQNVDSLYIFVQNEGGLLSEKQDDFLDDRNKNWIPLIVEHIKKEPSFIAVGAAHLGGPNGVIRLLEAQGYVLKPIKL